MFAQNPSRPEEQPTPQPRTRRSVVAALFATGAALALPGCHKTELPKLVQIGTFALVDADGKPFTQQNLEGKVWVVAFMFTRCPTVCPRMMRTMRDLQERGARAGAAFNLLSFSVDPDNDTPEVLRKYAAGYGADRANWKFLTGDFQTIRDTSVEGFKLALQGKADPALPDFGVLHSAYLVLLDKERNVRGYYKMTEDGMLDKLLSDAQSLE